MSGSFETRPDFFEPIPTMAARSRSPVGVMDYPSMQNPRNYYVLTTGGTAIVIDLHATINTFYAMHTRYQIPTNRHEHIQAFLQELRFATEPNLRRWTLVPNPYSRGETRNGAEWLIEFGVRADVIDLTVSFSDSEGAVMDSDDEDDEDSGSLLTQ